ncbi:MAG: vacuolar family H+-ATPase subunit H, partial [Hungatella sp.]
MSRIEQLIGEIEEYIDGCKFQPLSNSKIVVNKEEIEELLVELRLRIPDEIKKYQKIISNQDAILGEARTQADTMIQEATVHTNEL